MIRFAHPEFLYALALLPLMIVLFLLARQLRKRALGRFGNPVLIQQLTPAAAEYKRTVKSLLLICALGLLITALANPQIGTRMETIKREGVDIIIALDVSNSMKAEDFKPNRLENAKRQISLMLEQLEQDRIGVVVFAGAGYLQLPLTTDYGAARLFLSAIDTDIVPVQGTAIGAAIRLAMKSFVKGERKHRVIIIITDGENHEDDALEAAREAAKDGIIVHTIGMGSPEGAPIPVYHGETRVGFKKDGSGNVVVTKLNETILQQIASAGGGKYILATSSRNEMDLLFREIDSMEKKEIGVREFTDYEDRFQFPLGLALLLLVFEFFISERRSTIRARWKSWISFRTATLSCLILLLLALLAPLASAESKRSMVRSGNRHYGEEKYGDAEVSYRKALEKDKQFLQGVFNLGDALYKQERYAEAADQFRSAASLSNDDSTRAQAYYNLGNSLLKGNQLEESIASYKEALKLNPGDMDSKYNLEYARQLLNKQKQQEQQQKKNQEKNEEKKEQNQNQDQENQQEQSKNQEKQKEQKTQQQQPQQGSRDQKDLDEQKAPQRGDQISREDAERILEALKNEEKNVQKKLLKKVPAKVQTEKDW